MATKRALNGMTGCLAGAVACGLVGAPSAMADHAHVTVDTANGQIKIVTGYLFGEDNFTVDENGWLREDGEVFRLVCDQTWGGTPHTGWPVAIEQMTLTSDYFGATGRLDGGHFWYELAGVTAIEGDPTPTLIWAEEFNGTLVGIADSDSADRSKRSFELGFIGHIHEQRQLIEQPGLYEVSLIAWDSNGVYADSAPVRFYVEVPGCDADINGDGVVNTQDVLAFLNLWAAGDARGDFNGDGTVNTQDVLAFLNAWNTGC
ncbi:MAG: GC-type dockerin domain-anchored protein [Phycisphaerales bacterium JB054]